MPFTFSRDQWGKYSDGTNVYFNDIILTSYQWWYMDEDSVHRAEFQNKDWIKHSYISMRCWSCLLGDGHYWGTDTTGKSHYAPPQHNQFYHYYCCAVLVSPPPPPPPKFCPIMTYFWYTLISVPVTAMGDGHYKFLVTSPIPFLAIHSRV